MDGNAQVIAILSKNIEIPNKISGFQTAQLQLNFYQKKMEDLFSSLGEDTMTVEKTKNDRRNELIEKTLPVITILEIFAYYS